MYRLGLFLLTSGVCLMAQQLTQVPDVSAGQIAGPVAIGFGVAGGGFAFTGGMAFPGPPITGAPYSADTSTETVQMLADGNRIDQMMTGKVARDSQGRTRTEHSLPGNPQASTTSGATQLVTISDPPAGYTYLLDPMRKVAHRMPMKMGPVTAQAVQMKLQAGLEKAASPDGGAITKTDLGAQTINGVSAQGTKVTRTIPAGAIGNENPITSTTETWFAPSLKVLLMSKSDDPRMGQTTYQLTNIVRSEPAADLFQVPADYSIEDGPPKGDVVYAKP